jgi:hypothetical protein
LETRNILSSSSDEVGRLRRSLTGTSLQNAGVLRDLIATSHAANIAFPHHVVSVHDHDKLDLFLGLRDRSAASCR